jgi:hypothetical protein
VIHRATRNVNEPAKRLRFDLHHGLNERHFAYFDIRHADEWIIGPSPVMTAEEKIEGESRVGGAQ